MVRSIAATDRVVCPWCDRGAMRVLGDDLLQCSACGHVEWIGVEPKLPRSSHEEAVSEESAVVRRKKTSKVRRRRRRFEIAIGVAVVLFLLVTGVLIYLVVEWQGRPGIGEQVANAEWRELIEKVPWIEDEDLLQEVSTLVGDYLAATTAEEFVPLVVDGSEQKGRIENWLSILPAEPLDKVRVEEDLETFELVEAPWWRVRVIGFDEEDQPHERTVVVRVEKGATQVDWVATEGIGGSLWDRMLLDRSQEPVDMRVVAAPATVILEAEEIERGLRRVELRPARDRGVPVVALVEPGSEVETRLVELGLLSGTDDEEEAAERSAGVFREPMRLTVKLRFPAERGLFTGGRERVELIEILRGDWLAHPDN